MNFLNLGTYSPRLCGIATFSKNLRDNLTRLGERTSIAAVSDPYFTYTYPDEVLYIIRQNKIEDYASTANAVNKNSGIDLVIIQHEYGIYGGADGDYLLEFTARLKKPYLLVTHTILPYPTANQKVVLSALCRQAAAVVCMTKTSSSMLSRVYGAAPEKVYIIHHGVPAFRMQDRKLLKQEYGFEGRELITTFGLIGPGKGIEIGIRALKRLVMKHKNLMYLIVGRTHPMLVEHEGEHGDRYRETLIELVRRLGMQDHVEFVNKFLEPEELGEYLYMTDVYLSPYLDLNQAISGTLAYAMGCGRAIVSTPYLYALEMLSQGQRGLVADDTTAEALAESLDRVLSEPDLKLQLEKRAAWLGAKVKWPYIAKQYANLAESVLKSKIAI
ncbi:MAG: glycosyltransferase family 4 protein [Thermacetogeniaceae bacterium]|jgi:glycosyltransferase involved in cell wall biosynthesis